MPKPKNNHFESDYEFDSESESNLSEPNVTKLDSRYNEKQEPVGLDTIIEMQRFLELSSVQRFKNWKE